MSIHWADEDIEYDMYADDDDDAYYSVIQQTPYTRKDIKYLDYYEGWYPEYEQ